MSSKRYELAPCILEMPSFLYYDILDAETYVPPESIFSKTAGHKYLTSYSTLWLPGQYHPRVSRELEKICIYQKHR